MSEQALSETNLAGLRLFNRGKVRDIYELGENLLIVATDRLSAFDFVLPTAIPMKGKVLTGLTLFWLDFLGDEIENHLVTADVDAMGPEVVPHAELLRGRSMLARKAQVVPIECVVRGYLAGSGWKDYQKTGSVCGVSLPPGLREADQLPEPIFTPATKAESGHDENISFEQAAKVAGRDTAETLRRNSLAVYAKAVACARERGIIISDTKFEWGMRDDRIILIDEVLTPDSSRFWPADEYAPGGSPPSFDKQFVRDHLLASDWDRESPPPPLPDDVVAKTTEKYLQAYERLTGHPLV